MANDKKQERPSLIINGKPATQAEVKRIMRAPAQPASKKEPATSKIEQVDRGFRLMR